MHSLVRWLFGSKKSPDMYLLWCFAGITFGFTIPKSLSFFSECVSEKEIFLRFLVGGNSFHWERLYFCLSSLVSDIASTVVSRFVSRLSSSSSIVSRLGLTAFFSE